MTAQLGHSITYLDRERAKYPIRLLHFISDARGASSHCGALVTFNELLLFSEKYAKNKLNYFLHQSTNSFPLTQTRRRLPSRTRASQTRPLFWEPRSPPSLPHSRPDEFSTDTQNPDTRPVGNIIMECILGRLVLALQV